MSPFMPSWPVRPPTFMPVSLSQISNLAVIRCPRDMLLFYMPKVKTRENIAENLLSKAFIE